MLNKSLVILLIFILSPLVAEEVTTPSRNQPQVAFESNDFVGTIRLMYSQTGPRHSSKFFIRYFQDQVTNQEDLRKNTDKFNNLLKEKR